MVAGYNYNTYGGQSSPWLQNIYERYFQPQSYTYNFVGNIEDAVENVNANIAKKIRAFTLPPKRNGQPSDWVSHYSRLIKT